jgi:spore coat-associated protein N
MGISMKTTSGKIIASVALVGTAAAVAGLGTFGAFTATTSASQAVDAGTIKIDIASDNNTMTTPIVNILPGDTVTKFVTLDNTGDSNLGTVSLTTEAVVGKGETESLLTSDETHGLKITVESCATPWDGNTCAGSITPIANQPIIGANRDLGPVSSLTANADSYLKITTVLPATAEDDFQGAAGAVTFKFDATQRAAINS